MRDGFYLSKARRTPWLSARRTGVLAAAVGLGSCGAGNTPMQRFGEAARSQPLAGARVVASTRGETAVGLARSDGARLVYAPTQPHDSAQNPAYSPDGRTLVFSIFHGGYNGGAAGVYLIPRSGGTPKALFFYPGQDSVNLPGACWNAATRRITFASDLQTTDDVWTISPDGSRPVRITNVKAALHAIEPSFSADGRSVVFEVDTNAQDPNMYGSIWKANSDGSGLVELRGGPGSGRDDREPNWSPRGDRIVFQERLAGRSLEYWQVLTMDPAGKNVAQVTAQKGSNTDASWSPDAKWIVYSSDDGNTLPNANVYAIAASGGTPIRVSNAPSRQDDAPSWSPDGKHIAFESLPNGTGPAQLYEIAVPKLP